MRMLLSVVLLTLAVPAMAGDLCLTREQYDSEVLAPWRRVVECEKVSAALRADAQAAALALAEAQEQTRRAKRSGVVWGAVGVLTGVAITTLVVKVSQ